MSLIFKKATEKDIPIIAQLADVIWRKHYTSIITLGQIDYMLNKMYSPVELLKQMKEGHQFTLAYVNETPVGYISLSTKDNKNYFLNKFYVLVDEHRKGIGSQLFNYVLKQMPDAEAIELAVNRENYKAINFYFKLGFTIKHTFDLDIGGGYFMNDFLMIKKLVL
jgi:diamine N-acetyltransferase